MEGSVPIHHKPRTAKNNSFFSSAGQSIYHQPRHFRATGAKRGCEKHNCHCILSCAAGFNLRQISMLSIHGSFSESIICLMVVCWESVNMHFQCLPQVVP